MRRAASIAAVFENSLSLTGSAGALHAGIGDDIAPCLGEPQMESLPLTRLLVVRHGETRWNIENRYQGHGDSPLTETGLAQAAALGRRLSQVPFDALVSSDLERARTTAARIAAFTGHLPQTDSRLRERNFGILEGLTIDAILARHAKVYDSLQTGDPDYRPPQGESHRDHYRRNIAFLEEWHRMRPGTSAVWVVHGGVLDSLFRFVTCLPLTQPRCFVVPNASLSVLSHGSFYGTSRWVIEAWGQVDHLGGIGFTTGL